MRRARQEKVRRAGERAGARVEGFFGQQDQAAGAAWNSLREEVRAGRVAVDGLRQVHDEFPPEIRIDPFELDPSANTLEVETRTRIRSTKNMFRTEA